MRTLVMAILLWSFASGVALAVDPDEMLPDVALERRAREIGSELRCLVCQNQSIDDSDADLARDLRVIVRKRLTSGDSDETILRYVVDRYGEFVLLRPPVNIRTYALWYGPPLLFAIALLVVFASYRRSTLASEDTRPLSAKEEAEVERLIREQSER